VVKHSPIFAALLLLLAGPGARAAEPAPPAPRAVDPRVEAALTAAKLAYIVDEGDFRLKYDVDGDRSQLVWVASGTAKLDQLEIRDVWSVASRGKGEPPAELAAHLLRENARMILGAWQINQNAEEYLVVFSAPVLATADAATLQEVIEVVMLSADRIEKELTGRDEF
jgi:glycerate-2-kinase